ncbi:uncharacterized protein [Drosophila kikkawai]|uniref:Uncharacterized protein n=1 Tax=Drosophila kikkawai TaxID=30033 RepID=A0ABM4GLP4_DROKI
MHFYPGRLGAMWVVWQGRLAAANSRTWRINRILRICERLPHKLHFNFAAFLATAYKSAGFRRTRRRQLLLVLCRILALGTRRPAPPLVPLATPCLRSLRFSRGQATRNIEISI